MRVAFFSSLSSSSSSFLSLSLSFRERSAVFFSHRRNHHHHICRPGTPPPLRERERERCRRRRLVSPPSGGGGGGGGGVPSSGPSSSVSSSSVSSYIFWCGLMLSSSSSSSSSSIGRRRRRRRRRKRRDDDDEEGTRPSRGPKCVGFALGADVLVRPHHQKETSSSSSSSSSGVKVKEALQKAIEFWATRAKCASVVLYFDIECERSARRYANEVMEIWAEKENRTIRSKKRSERRRRGRTVRVKLYSKETPPGKTEAIGEYFLDTGEDVVEEDWANGQNDGWLARWWRSSSVSLSSSSARLRRTTARRRRRTTAASKKKTNDDDDDDKPMDIIVLTSSTGYDILSGFTKSLKQRRRKMSRTNEEKETFLSSLLPSSKGSKSSSLEPPKPKTVALIEQELKVNFLENQLPTPELLVSVSQVFSVGKFPGFLLSKCELAHVESIERMTEDAVHRKILREYLRSFQRFGS